ncbi:MAG: class I SAM-dependent methyltransferase [Crocinitomicaceae bacterium]|nr:class I SAM-dependent methyltransferase [Crocinitomicaceae bacterium]MBK8927875.1 class I SAM-dependent methyltransferase [Crocinitomicaceae bacterium]
MENNLIYLDRCPICHGFETAEFITSKDFSVSGETFTIVSCGSCGFKFTNPRPVEQSIGSYYKSDGYVSHSATKKGFVNKVYHLVRKYTLAKKVALINRLSKGRKLLDIGSGTGHFVAKAKLKGWDVKGLEPDTDARRIAQEVNSVALNDIIELHSLSEKFDIITLWHVLEHVYHLERDASKIASLLTDNGRLVIAVPNPESFDAQYYKEFWAAYDLPIHLYHFKKTDIIELLGRFDLELIDVLPMKFDSFYVSMLSEKYRGGKLSRAILTGLKSNWLAGTEKWSSQIYILRRKTH